MQYNLAEHSIVNSNTDVGNIPLTTVEILPITQTTSASGTTISGTDILCLDCDLGARVQIDEIRYYFSSVSVSGTVADSINFYHKNEEFEVYVSLETFLSSNYYYATVTSGTSSPRHLRMIHTISGTDIYGTVNGFQVMNNDDIVDFGTDGSKELENFEMDLEYNSEEIRPVYIYNDGDIKSDAYALLEPQGTLIDEMLSISNSQDGPWYSPLQYSNIISGYGAWDAGNYVNTVIVYDHLELVTGSGIGTYITRIFDTIDTQKFTYLHLSTTYPEDGVKVATNEDDIQQTIEIKSSNIKPIDYITYRKFIPYELDEEGDIPLKYREYCMYDDSVLFTSPNLIDTTWVYNWATYWDGDSRGRFYIDKINKRTAAIFRYYATSGCKVRLVQTDSDGNYDKTYTLASYAYGYLDLYSYSLLMDTVGGIWFYVYFGGSNGWFDQTDSYYLAYFDRDMTEIFKMVDNSAFMYDMDIVRSNGNLWYTNQETRRLVQLNKTGEILSEFTFQSDVKGVAAKEDGSCWVIRGTAISNISPGNEVLSTIDLASVVSVLTRVAIDGDDALWVADDNYVRRILLNGTVDFSVDVLFQPTELQVYDTGVAVFCVDRSWRFISRDYKRIIKTIENTDGKNMYIGVQGAEYDNLVYADEFPIPFDVHWNNLEWNTVAADNYLLPENKYNQIKLTLRANESLTSPIVNGIYLNESVQVQNIYPKNYKTMYIKTDISDQDTSVGSSYESNLKVWWYIPV